MSVILVKDKADLSRVHISALTIACRRLWIGTGNGIVVSVPWKDNKSNIPYCSIDDAQFSLHGYRDAVKFFVAVPGKSTQKSRQQEQQTSEATTTFGDVLIASGGDGYVDLRLGDGPTVNEDPVTHRPGYSSYLIVWHLGSH